MAVTAYDGQFSFRQNELATKGRDATKGGLTEEQFKDFQESPFMKKARKQEEHTWTMTCDRDRRRKERDPAFQPQDSDFTAAKAFDYDKQVNYYTVLGVDEFASLDDIKKAYKRLSLIYHPDKTAGMPKEQQEEHSAIFIELKNAYLTLGDQATRRQYDRDRDFLDAGVELNGFKKRKDKVPFDAAAVLKKLQELQKPPGAEVPLEVLCKIEKFFYGGSKLYRRSRRMIKDSYEYHVDKVFRIDVPRGSEEPLEVKMKGGDMNWDKQPDTLKFIVRSKPHKVVERKGFDLLVTKPVILKPDTHLQPFLTTEVNTIGGRTILLWGRNPLYSQLGSANASLEVAVRGEGIGPTGTLRFSARLGAAGRDAVKTAKSIVVCVRTTYTKIEFFCSVPADATVEDLKQSIAAVLDWPEDRPMKLAKLSDPKFEQPLNNDRAPLGALRAVLLDPPEKVCRAPMSILRARELLGSVTVFSNEEAFAEELRKTRKSAGLPEYGRLVRELWDVVARMAPFYGYSASFQGLRAAVERALWVIRDEPDAAFVHERFADLGFRPREPVKPRIPKRRTRPRPDVELFFARNDLGPPSWRESGVPEPGSETDPDQPEEAPWRDEGLEDEELDFTVGASSGSGAGPDSSARRSRRSHGSYAAAMHPQVMRRAERREKVTPICELEFSPLFGQGNALQLFTTPTCTLHFYSNLKQVWTAKPGHLRPRQMFAVAVSCPSGAKRNGREDWTRLRHRLVPILKHVVFLTLAEARGILPRPLPSNPVFDEGAYSLAEGARVLRPGEDELDIGQVGEESDDENVILALARQRVAKTSAGSEGSGGGMFDFDDLEDLDELENTATAIRLERRIERRRRAASREVWCRDAYQQAKQTQYFKERPAESAGSASLGGEAAREAAAWKQMATRAFRHSNFFLAQLYYSRELELRPEEDAQNRAVVLSNRSACLAKVRHFEAALEDARRAAELRPNWGRAWSRVGAAAASLGTAFAEESRTAWFKAVELEPILQNIEGLAKAHQGAGRSSVDASHHHKERGNEASRVQEWGTAIAQYTVGIAALPPRPENVKQEDEYDLLRAILYANRSAALARVRLWDLAVTDAETSISFKADYGKGHCRLGVARLGCSMNEAAYIAFAAAVAAEEKDQSARKGREVCLGLLPLWESRAAVRRCERYGRDAGRPLGTTKVYAVSDVHFDHSANEEWVHNINSTKFLDDVLIIAGNVADSFKAIRRGLSALRSKFRRIFYLPGNHEMWITPPERARFPDSLSKLWAILELCDELDIDVRPAAICQGVFVVPLFSWYNAGFDVQDPFPDPKLEADKYAKWPMDPEQQVWRYMLRLNRLHLEKTYPGTVITFSHFAPRRNCPVWKDKGNLKTSGCLELDEQIRGVRSSCHVYGHTRFRFTQAFEGLTYVNRPIEGEPEDPIQCIFDGEDLCSEPTDVR